jgi:hypothetical protein
MGIWEVWILIVAQQALTAGAKFCAAGEIWAANALGKAGFNYGGQFLANMSTLAMYGGTAAQAEFATKQTAEAKFVSQANTLPPIT